MTNASYQVLRIWEEIPSNPSGIFFQIDSKLRKYTKSLGVHTLRVQGHNGLSFSRTPMSMKWIDPSLLLTYAVLLRLWSHRLSATWLASSKWSLVPLNYPVLPRQSVAEPNDEWGNHTGSIEPWDVVFVRKPRWHRPVEKLNWPEQPH